MSQNGQTYNLLALKVVSHLPSQEYDSKWMHRAPKTHQKFKISSWNGCQCHALETGLELKTGAPQGHAHKVTLSGIASGTNQPNLMFLAAQT